MSSRPWGIRMGVVALALWPGEDPAHAGAPAPFTEEAIQRGVLYTPDNPQTFGSGFALADLDNDGDADLVLVGRTSVGTTPTVAVYENDGTGHFIDRSAGSGIPDLPLATGVVAADYDADGDLDLYITCWIDANALLRNEGNFVFTDVAAQAGVDDIGAGSGACWGDYDGDGWLDLYVPNRTETSLPGQPPSMVPNRLYRNQGDGTFEEVAAQLGVDDGLARSFQACFFDFDRDHDADLYLANDKGLSTNCQWTNHLFENVGGTFVDISQSSGTGGCIDAMCIAVGDFDANGWQDIYVTNLPVGNVLYLNNGDGTFSENARMAGVESFAVGWGAFFFDFDNDTWLDLYVCNSFTVNRLYAYDGTWPARDIADVLGVADPGMSFCAATADLDLDGDLDIVVSNTAENIKLYINHEGQRRNWVRFRVVGQGANTWGIGANVLLDLPGKTLLREVIAGSGFKTQDDLVLHFGLDQAGEIPTTRVFWPGGTSRIIRNLKANFTWTLYPPERLGDADGDGHVLLNDFLVFEDCHTGPGSGLISPGCEMMDFDGDADVDLDDLDAFLARYEGPFVDCNDNGVHDFVDIIRGTANDANRNGRIDACECLGDLDGDGQIGLSDLARLLAAFGSCAGDPSFDPDADLDADGCVALADLSLLLDGFGTTCP